MSPTQPGRVGPGRLGPREVIGMAMPSDRLRGHVANATWTYRAGTPREVNIWNASDRHQVTSPGFTTPHVGCTQEIQLFPFSWCRRSGDILDFELQDFFLHFFWQHVANTTRTCREASRIPQEVISWERNAIGMVT